MALDACAPRRCLQWDTKGEEPMTGSRITPDGCEGLHKENEMKASEMKRARSFFKSALSRLLLTFAIGGMVLAVLVIPGKPTAGSADANRIMVLLSTDITDAILSELSLFGKIHGWIDRYRLVTMTPHGGTMRSYLPSLPYVESVETDALGELLDVGIWSRDMIDVVDAEESGDIGEPDQREVEWTGAGVYVAVIDTGMLSDWRDFIPEERVDTTLARSFAGAAAGSGDFVFANEFGMRQANDHFWERDSDGHGIGVASHVTGFRAGGYLFDGVAPEAKVIPLRVSDESWQIFLSRAVAAVAHVADLAREGIGPIVINMSLGWTMPIPIMERAIDDAIDAGVIVVVAAGNSGEAGMLWPGAYPQVISAGMVAWTKQFRPGSIEEANLDFWFNEDVGFDPDRGRRGLEVNEAVVAPPSSRAIKDPVSGLQQELDVLAPGAFSVGPARAVTNQPWTAGPVFTSFPRIAYWTGTSFASPTTAGVAALMLQKNPLLTQTEVEALLKSTAMPVKPNDSRTSILIPSGLFPGAPAGFEGTVWWDEDCNGRLCDPVGAGLLQADDALAATPAL